MRPRVPPFETMAGGHIELTERRRGTSDPLRSPAEPDGEPYMVVPDEDVPPETRLAALRALRFAAKDLGIVPEIVWFRHSVDETVHLLAGVVHRLERMAGKAGDSDHRAPFRDDRINGVMFFRHEGRHIFVSADLAPNEAAYVAAHEARHAWQLANGLVDNVTPEVRATAEQDANLYAQLAYRKTNGGRE